MRIEEADKNFRHEEPDGEGMEFCEVKPGTPFSVHGFTQFPETGKFERLPAEVARAVGAQLEFLNAHTAGGRVRFCTDSPELGVKYRGTPSVMPHVTPLMVGGFDVYCGKTFVSAVMPQPPFGKEYACRVPLLPDGKMHDYTVNFPLYGTVEELFLGVKKGARLSSPKPYPMKPVVIYGPSLTQGGCSSRPGTCYPAYISRALNCDYYNFGFSGNAMGEPELARYLSTIDVAAFIFDYDYNAPDAEHLRRTHETFYKIYREARPDTPVVFASRTDRAPDAAPRREIILATYEHALQRGEKVAFVDGATAFPASCRAQCTVDGGHPNDLGFYFLAKKFLSALRSLL